MDKEGEEDVLEIGEETVCFNQLCQNETPDARKIQIQAEYTNGLMQAYRERFPGSAWRFPSEMDIDLDPIAILNDTQHSMLS